MGSAFLFIKIRTHVTCHQQKRQILRAPSTDVDLNNGFCSTSLDVSIRNIPRVFFVRKFK
jgi:hypothetical protein